MLFIKHQNTNPYMNHAIEEYVMQAFNEDCFILWRNRPCVLIGKNQNTLSEINIDYVKKHNLSVVRRMSGGGSIFNDLGTLNFTFISVGENNVFADFSKFTYPIIRALKKLSVNAELSGRNDLVIDGKKISGNAQYKHGNKILHHGSILFSVNMKNLNEALYVNPIKFSDKAVKSVRSRVTNIYDYIKSDMTIIEFKEFLIKSVISEDENPKIYTFSTEEWKKIKEICSHKYETWEWNYGHLKKFNYSNEKKFPGGIVQVNIYVKKGIIGNIKFFGDFFSSCEIGELENKFLGIKYEKEEIVKILENVDIERYMHNINKKHIMEVMLK